MVVRKYILITIICFLANKESISTNLIGDWSFEHDTVVFDIPIHIKETICFRNNQRIARIIYDKNNNIIELNYGSYRINNDHLILNYYISYNLKDLLDSNTVIPSQETDTMFFQVQNNFLFFQINKDSPLMKYKKIRGEMFDAIDFLNKKIKWNIETSQKLFENGECKKMSLKYNLLLSLYENNYLNYPFPKEFNVLNSLDNADYFELFKSAKEYYNKKDYQLALRYLKCSLIVNPNDKQVCNLLVEVLQEFGTNK